MLTVVIILKGKRLSYMYRKNTQCSLLLQISMIRKCKHKCKKKRSTKFEYQEEFALYEI